MARKLYDRLSNALLTHDTSEQQQILIDVIVQTTGAMRAANATEVQIMEKLFGVYGDAIAGWMMVDALSGVAERQERQLDRAPLRSARIAG